MVYADNAATTKLDMDAFEAMRPFLLESYSNPSQPYSFARDSKRAIKAAKESIASCIGADADEIIITSGGTESDNWAIKMGASGGNVVTSAIEHHAVLNSCETYANLGHKVYYLPVDKEGLINLNDLENAIDNETKLVSIMFANNEIGTIQPISKISEIVHQHGCLFHTDAVQAVGHINMNVHQLGIDLLSASAHKFNGPKGIGFLYVRKGIAINPYIDGGNQEWGHRAGTENVASIVAMSVALKKNCDLIQYHERNLSILEHRLIGGLNEMGLDYIQNGSSIKIPGNISLSFKGYSGESLLHRLDLLGICISTGSACDSVNTNVSHVIRAISVPSEYATGTIRITLGRDNTKDDVDMILEGLKKIMVE